MELESCVSCCSPRQVLLELILPKTLYLSEGTRGRTRTSEMLAMRWGERQYTERALGKPGPQTGNGTCVREEQKPGFPSAALPVLPDFPHILRHHRPSLAQVTFQGAGFGVSWLPEVAWNMTFVRCHIRVRALALCPAYTPKSPEYFWHCMNSGKLHSLDLRNVNSWHSVGSVPRTALVLPSNMTKNAKFSMCLMRRAGFP